MSILKPKISIITLAVSDITDSRHFYEDTLGLEVSEHSNENIVFFEFDGSWLALHPQDKLAEDAQTNVAGSGFTLAHNVASKEAVDDIFAELTANDVTITKKPVQTDWGGYSGYFTDPDGYAWEVAYNPHFDLN
jgi:catechol 2,3-dioxygenase-like lactoylglutathione lyase family enzyme